MTRSLDSGRQLSLMICAGTGNTAGENFSSLGHALAELCDILVINFLSSVNTEHTNLLTTLSYRSCGSFHGKILLTSKLMRVIFRLRGALGSGAGAGAGS